MKIRISSPDGTAANAKVELEDGSRLDHVTDIVIRGSGRSGVITADLRFSCPGLDFAGLSATVSEEHLRELAAGHGFDLVKRG